jgi:hypothetical protein
LHLADFTVSTVAWVQRSATHGLISSIGLLPTETPKTGYLLRKRCGKTRLQGERKLDTRPLTHKFRSDAAPGSFGCSLADLKLRQSKDPFHRKKLIKTQIFFR